MSDAQLKDDFTLDDLLENGVSGQLVPYNGYLRAEFTDTTREGLEKVFGALVDATISDYKKIDEKRQRNLDAHDGIPEKGQAMVIPIAKRDSNQQLAWLLTTLFKDPFITVRPLEAGHVQVVSQDQNGQPQVTSVTTDKEARDLQDLVNFYLLDKIAFKKTLRILLAEMLRDGNRPPLLKVLHEDREYQVGSLNMLLGLANTSGETPAIPIRTILEDPMLSTVKDGEPTRIDCVAGDSFFIPFPEYDIQSAPFVFQCFEEDTVTIKKKIADGKYDFCLPQGQEPDDEALESVLLGMDEEERSKAKRNDGRIPSDPLKKHKMLELWFYYPFADKVDDKGDPVYTIHSFCSVFHCSAKKFLTCYENPYWHSRRPFHVGYMQQRPFSFSGYSTTENVAPFQRLISQLFHLQVQNMVQSNVKVFLVRRTSSTFKFLANKKLRPGLVIPFDEQGDVDPQPLGSPITSMSSEIAFLNSESEKMSVVTQYDRGNIPNRTPAATIAAVENLAKMQPAMVLDQVRETIGEAVKMFVQTLIQYAPTGITIPYFDPAKKATIQRIISFPREMIVNQFAFEVTATAEDQTPEAKFNKNLQLMGQVNGFANQAMAIGAAVWKPMTPPPIINFGTKVVLGQRRLVAQMLEDARYSPDDFMPTETEIQQIPGLLLQLQQTIQTMSGGQGGIPGAGAGGAVPPPGGIGGPAPFMAGQSNDQGNPSGPVQGALPPVPVGPQG